MWSSCVSGEGGVSSSWPVSATDEIESAYALSFVKIRKSESLAYKKFQLDSSSMEILVQRPERGEY